MNTTSRPLGVTNVMADICTHDVVSYLKENYITAEDASRRAGVSEMRLWQLVDSKCVPPLYDLSESPQPLAQQKGGRRVWNRLLGEHRKLMRATSR